MEETKKYVCLLPTDGYATGDVVDLTEEQFAGHNANEPEPRFAPFEETEDAPAEEVAPEATPEGEEVAPTEPVAPEAPAEEVAPAPEGEDAGGASQEGTDAVVTETTPEGEATVATDGEGA